MDAATLPYTEELLPPVAHTIWDMKYRFKERDGTPVDQTMDDTRLRVARALAANDTEETMFSDAMRGWKFLPADRILAGAGTDRQVTLINCFVLGQIDDSLSGIMDGLKDAATTMQAGGGIGHDFSTLRPKGAPLHPVSSVAQRLRSTHRRRRSHLDYPLLPCLRAGACGRRRRERTLPGTWRRPAHLFHVIRPAKHARRVRALPQRGPGTREAPRGGVRRLVAVRRGPRARVGLLPLPDASP